MSRSLALHKLQCQTGSGKQTHVCCTSTPTRTHASGCGRLCAAMCADADRSDGISRAICISNLRRFPRCSIRMQRLTMATRDVHARVRARLPAHSAICLFSIRLSTENRRTEPRLGSLRSTQWKRALSNSPSGKTCLIFRYDVVSRMTDALSSCCVIT